MTNKFAFFAVVYILLPVKAFVVPNTFHDYNHVIVLLSQRGVTSGPSSPKKTNSFFDFFKGKKHKSSIRNESSLLINQSTPPPANGTNLSSGEIQLNHDSPSNHSHNNSSEKLHKSSTIITNQTQSHEVTGSSTRKKSHIFFDYFKSRKRNASRNNSSLIEGPMELPQRGTFLRSEEMALKNKTSSNLQNNNDAEKLRSSPMLINDKKKLDQKIINNIQGRFAKKRKYKFFDSWVEQQQERYKPFEFLKAGNAPKEISANATRNINSSYNKNNASKSYRNNSSIWINNQRKPIMNDRKMNNTNPRLANTFKFFDALKETPQQVNKQFELLKNGENSTRTDKFITLSDLEDILRSNGYVKKDDSKIATSAKVKMEEKSTSVAFPQPNPVTYRDLIISTTISSSLIGTIVGSTVSRNLWLVGGLSLGCWGYEIARNYENAPPTNVMSELLVSVGRRLAELYHYLYFGINGLWFMYKTGQLSYVYWKQYAQLDDRLSITTKMDSWNEKFKEGKRNFDRWEQDNEIGRKVLAGLRAIAYNKQRRRWCMTQYYQRLRESIENRLQGSGEEFTAVLKGIRRSIAQQRLDEVFPRALAALEAWTLLSLVGALFAIAPSLLGFLAVIVGLVWPTWAPEFRRRFSEVVDELSQQGRLDSSTIQEIGKQRFYDKTRYHYFTRDDGTKRFYRTGQSTKVVGKTTTDKNRKRKEIKQNQKPWWSRSRNISQPKAQKSFGFFQF